MLWLTWPLAVISTSASTLLLPPAAGAADAPPLTAERPRVSRRAPDSSALASAAVLDTAVSPLLSSRAILSPQLFSLVSCPMPSVTGFSRASWSLTKFLRVWSAWRSLVWSQFSWRGGAGW